MTEWENIEDLEIDGLTPILKTRKPVRIQPHRRKTTICRGLKDRFESGRKCGEIDQIVRIYSILQLDAAIRFYKQVAERPEMLYLLKGTGYQTSTSINEACDEYFRSKQLDIPDPQDKEIYEDFLRKNPQLRDFNSMACEPDLVNTILKGEEKPTDYDGVMQRLIEILPEQHYLQIDCCKEHLEATIKHAINLTWNREKAMKKRSLNHTPTDPINTKDLHEDSLIYAPQSREGMVVRLCSDVDYSIYGKAVQVEHFFDEMMRDHQESS